MLVGSQNIPIVHQNRVPLHHMFCKKVSTRSLEITDAPPMCTLIQISKTPIERSHHRNLERVLISPKNLIVFFSSLLRLYGCQKSLFRETSRVDCLIFVVTTIIEKALATRFGTSEYDDALEGVFVCDRLGVSRR